MDQDEPQSSSKAFDQNDNTAETDRKTLNWQLALEEAKETEKLSLNCDIEEEREESVEISSEEKTMQYFFFTDCDPRLLTGMYGIMSYLPYFPKYKNPFFCKTLLVEYPFLGKILSYTS